MTLKVKRCCDASFEQGLYAAYEVKPNQSITIQLDDYSDYDEVKFCAYCGKALELERTPDTPKPEPYMPDYSSLTARNRALEELKEQMDAQPQNH